MLFLWVTNAYSQQLPFENITPNDGLSQGMIFDIHQSKDGYLWFATKDGLNRYDGHNFKVYRNEIDDPYSISGNVLTEIAEDKEGRLWISSQNNGLNMYDPEKDQFYHFRRPIGGKFPNKRDWMNNILIDHSGRIWLGGNSTGVYRLDINLPKVLESHDLTPYVQMEFFPIPQKSNEDNNGVMAMYESSDHRILIGTTRGLYEIKDDIEEIVIPDVSSGSSCSSILEIAPNQYILGRNEYFTFWDGQTNAVSYSLFPDLEYSSRKAGAIFMDDKNRIWLSQRNQDLYTIQKEEIINGVFNPVKIHDFEKGSLSSFLKDETGTYWFGMNGYGLYKYNPLSEAFNSSVKGTSIMSIYEDSYQRIFYKHIYNTKAITILDDGRNHESAQRNINQYIQKYKRIKKIFELDPERFLLFSQSIFMNSVAILAECDKDFNIKEIHSLSDGAFTGFAQPSKTDDIVYLIDQNRYLIKYHLGDKNSQLFDLFDKLKGDDQYFFFNSIYEDYKGDVWCLSQQGLIHVKNISTQPEFEYYKKGNNKQSLRSNYILSVMDDPKYPEQFIWIGTKNGGLHRLDKKNNTFDYFSTKDGLPNDVIYGILPEGNDKLWLSTNNGICAFDLNDFSTVNYRISDGLQDNEFNTNAFAKGKNGRLNFGGINGLNSFYPNEVQNNKTNPSINITQLKINNEVITVHHPIKILSQPIHQTQQIELRHDQNMISLEFAVMDFTAPDKNSFKYKLENADTRWNITHDHRVNYNLNPGQYTFRLYGKSNQKEWLENPIELKIIIHPPWWNSTGSHIIYGILFLGGIFGIYKFQTQRFKLKNDLAFEQSEAKRLQELDQVKSEFFSNITHEFRTPLTLIIEPIRQLLKDNQNNEQKKKLQLVEKNSSHLLNLVNQLLDLSKLEHNKMKVELHHGNILDAVHPIIQSFAPLAEKKNTQLQLNAPLKIEAYNFDKRKIEKIIYNLISNAIKYTPNNSQVLVSILPLQNQLQIQVKDNGEGIPKDAIPYIFDRFYQVDGSSTRKNEGTGIGLALTKELTELMNGKIEVESIVGEGSTFTITFPIEYEKQPELSSQEQIAFHSTKEQQSPENTTSYSIVQQSDEVVLIIEDNDELRAFISQSLPQRYEIIEAPNGNKGIQLAKEKLPDIIISDLMMPEKNGYEVCEEIKTNELTSHIPIILLTAKTSIESKLRGLKYGADAYMSKPFNTEELIIRIEKLIEIRRTLIEKYTKGETSIKKEKIFSDYDQIFLNRVHQIFENNLENDQFGVNELSEKLKLSRSQLHRKIKALSQQSVGEYLRNFRLEKAHQLLKDDQFTVLEVTEKTGFKHQSYFARVFKEKYGILPKDIKRIS